MYQLETRWDPTNTILLARTANTSYCQVAWIETKLSFDQKGSVSTSETTIWVLGGLLSTYYLTSDQLFLICAVDLASNGFRHGFWPSTTICQLGKSKRNCRQIQHWQD
ncbi:hypothetical protein BT96DRAFT_1072403 [Gymnopus androsaceus JB14]|uniref:mannosyl-oligosaccharide 1,2-alpha-mannosidase n=1 Tax=Gymnopus androsaceus JB14 TaxID=1447944 RepID=A0A6A4GTU4_9AGAR|nr:hypothetical protein BT96DRAFT_1072403 [Gymnopus androsaceus JB14]